MGGRDPKACSITCCPLQCVLAGIWNWKQRQDSITGASIWVSGFSSRVCNPVPNLHCQCYVLLLWFLIDITFYQVLMFFRLDTWLSFVGYDSNAYLAWNAYAVLLFVMLICASCITLLLLGREWKRECPPKEPPMWGISPSLKKDKEP